MTRMNWKFLEDGLGERDQEEWDNLGSPKKPSSKGKSLGDILSIETIPIGDPLRKFVEGLPDEARALMDSAVISGEEVSALRYARDLLRITEYLKEQNYHPTVRDELASTLRFSASNPDGFRGILRGFQAMTAGMLSGPLPYGVEEVAGTTMPPPADNLTHIVSTLDEARRIEAYWSEGTHTIWTAESGGESSYSHVYEVFETVYEKPLEAVTIAESLLRLAIDRDIGTTHWYIHLVDFVANIRRDYLKALIFVHKNWTSPGIERELRAIIETASKIQPVVFDENHALGTHPSMMYLGTWSAPPSYWAMRCNLDGSQIEVGENLFTPEQAARRYRAAIDPVFSDAIFAALSTAHAVGLIEESPEMLLRRDQASGGCPICLDVLLRKGEVPLVCTGCGRGETA
jgi:hypothetical protein